MKHQRQIQECVLNIDMLCRSMYLSYIDIKKFKIPLSSAIYGDMISYSYIQLCSILDEFVILNGIAKNDEYLKETLYVVSPALKALNKYNGLRKARNTILAHFNRDKNNNFQPWWISMKNLNLPRTFKEINQIYTWLHLINGIIVSRYYEELKKISESSQIEMNIFMNWVKEQERINDSTPTPFDSIYNDVESRMKAIGLSELNVDPAMTEIIELINNKK